MPKIKPSETVDISTLRPHPKNYQKHPEEQLKHLRQSIKEHGLYRNVVIAKDSTILAGHGVVEAAKSLGIKEIPVMRLNIASDSPKAMKVITGDNEIGNLGVADERMLSDLLKDIADIDELLGTGFDEAQLASLVMVSRPSTEITDIDEAAEWVGLPEFERKEHPVQLVLNMKDESVRKDLIEKLGVFVSQNHGRVMSANYPPRPRQDRQAHEFS